ncbi:hypothetical protein A3Q56_00707 [Intoshia linei]|uniref:Uncharacterized protein n=1 Tax=Intoshia linei TaxID=1819745 RepID=A0A177BBB3_9BILA|nr:hypothetical protein A3Q56_00707 [Intoshia linei]
MAASKTIDFNKLTHSENRALHKAMNYLIDSTISNVEKISTITEYKNEVNTNFFFTEKEYKNIKIENISGLLP